MMICVLVVASWCVSLVLIFEVVFVMIMLVLMRLNGLMVWVVVGVGLVM